MNSGELSRAFGMVSLTDLTVLKQLVEMCGKTPTVVDIGTGAGTSLLAILEANSDARVTTVDITHTAAPDRVQRAGFDERSVVFLTEDSRTVGKAWKTPIDLLFVDGDWKLLMEDLVCWVPHVCLGGVVAIHDYGTRHPLWLAVKQVADVAFRDPARWKRVGLGECLVGFRRLQGGNYEGRSEHAVPNQ